MEVAHSFHRYERLSRYLAEQTDRPSSHHWSTLPTFNDSSSFIPPSGIARADWPSCTYMQSSGCYLHPALLHHDRPYSFSHWETGTAATAGSYEQPKGPEERCESLQDYRNAPESFPSMVGQVYSDTRQMGSIGNLPLHVIHLKIISPCPF